MPTVGVHTKIYLSSREARTTLKGFHKAISAESVTTKVIVLAPGATGSVNLQSNLIIVIGPQDVLNITINNVGGESLTYESVGFLMIQANNLYSMTIQNTSAEEITLELIF